MCYQSTWASMSLRQQLANVGKMLLNGLKQVPGDFRSELQNPGWQYFFLFILFQKEKLGDLISVPKSLCKPQNIVQESFSLLCLVTASVF